MATKVIAHGYNFEQLFTEVSDICECAFDDAYKVIVSKTRDEEGDVIHEIAVESDDEAGIERLAKLWKVFEHRYDIRPYYMARFVNEETMSIEEIPNSISRDVYKTNAATYDFVREHGEGTLAVIYKVVPQTYYTIDEEGIFATLDTEEHRREQRR